MRAFVVDAFTDTAFRGNPAGVVLLDDAGSRIPDEGWMQQVAAEFRHAETAFVRSRPDGGYDLRWFTPQVEVDLCGHATLATAHVLASLGASGRLSFATRSGTLHADAADGRITLDFPAQPVHPIPVPESLAAGIGVAVATAHANDADVLVELPAAADVVAIVPDLVALMAIASRGVVVTARADEGADHDFVSRFFGPNVGVDEDPVTGSAHCALGPYWSERLARTELVGVQVSPRGGRVGVRVLQDRVLLAGSAVTVLAGELLA
jgi:PhzF family phenazine biosynthesis protein